MRLHALRSALGPIAAAALALVAGCGPTATDTPPASDVPASSAAPPASGLPASEAPAASDLPASEAPPSSAAPVSDFAFDPPGQLHGGPGSGVADPFIYVPGMRFPIQAPKAFANSQVYGHGGLNGPGGVQCDGANYAYPWHDNFCETRAYSTPLCPAGTGHQGQDIRPNSCAAKTYVAVAAEDGTIGAISSYIVHLLTPGGRDYLYLHLQMNQLNVVSGQHVVRGQPIGKVSNNFGNTSTTIHLHFEIKQPVTHNGASIITRVPPYTSLVDAYQRMEAGTP